MKLKEIIVDNFAYPLSASNYLHVDTNGVIDANAAVTYGTAYGDNYLVSIPYLQDYVAANATGGGPGPGGDGTTYIFASESLSTNTNETTGVKTISVKPSYISSTIKNSDWSELLNNANRKTLSTMISGWGFITDEDDDDTTYDGDSDTILLNTSTKKFSIKSLSSKLDEGTNIKITANADNTVTIGISGTFDFTKIRTGGTTAGYVKAYGDGTLYVDPASSTGQSVNLSDITVTNGTAGQFIVVNNNGTGLTFKTVTFEDTNSTYGIVTNGGLSTAERANSDGGANFAIDTTWFGTQLKKDLSSTVASAPSLPNVGDSKVLIIKKTGTNTSGFVWGDAGTDTYYIYKDNGNNSLTFGTQTSGDTGTTVGVSETWLSSQIVSNLSTNVAVPPSLTNIGDSKVLTIKKISNNTSGFVWADAGITSVDLDDVDAGTGNSNKLVVVNNSSTYCTVSNGTGLVKVTDGVIDYDTSTYITTAELTQANIYAAVAAIIQQDPQGSVTVDPNSTNQTITIGGGGGGSQVIHAEYGDMMSILTDSATATISGNAETKKIAINVDFSQVPDTDTWYKYVAGNDNSLTFGTQNKSDDTHANDVTVSVSETWLSSQIVSNLSTNVASAPTLTNIGDSKVLTIKKTGANTSGFVWADAGITSVNLTDVDAGTGNSSKLITVGTGTTLITSTGNGFVKVANGVVSYDNSTYVPSTQADVYNIVKNIIKKGTSHSNFTIDAKDDTNQIIIADLGDGSGAGTTNYIYTWYGDSTSISGTQDPTSPTMGVIPTWLSGAEASGSITSVITSYLNGQTGVKFLSSLLSGNSNITIDAAKNSSNKWKVTLNVTDHNSTYGVVTDGGLSTATRANSDGGANFAIDTTWLNTQINSYVTKYDFFAAGNGYAAGDSKDSVNGATTLHLSGSDSTWDKVVISGQDGIEVGSNSAGNIILTGTYGLNVGKQSTSDPYPSIRLTTSNNVKDLITISGFNGISAGYGNTNLGLTIDETWFHNRMLVGGPTNQNSLEALRTKMYTEYTNDFHQHIALVPPITDMIVTSAGNASMRNAILDNIQMSLPPGYKRYSITSGSDNIVTAYVTVMDESYYNNMYDDGYKTIRDVVANLITHNDQDMFSGFVTLADNATATDSIYTISTAVPIGSQSQSQRYASEYIKYELAVNPTWLTSQVKKYLTGTITVEGGSTVSNLGFNTTKYLKLTKGASNNDIILNWADSTGDNTFDYLIGRDGAANDKVLKLIVNGTTSSLQWATVSVGGADGNDWYKYASPSNDNSLTFDPTNSTLCGTTTVKVNQLWLRQILREDNNSVSNNDKYQLMLNDMRDEYPDIYVSKLNEVVSAKTENGNGAEQAIRRHIFYTFDSLPQYNVLYTTSGNGNDMYLTGYYITQNSAYFIDAEKAEAQGYRTIREVVSHLLADTNNNKFSGFVKSYANATAADSLYTTSSSVHQNVTSVNGTYVPTWDSETIKYSMQVNPAWISGSTGDGYQAVRMALTSLLGTTSANTTWHGFDSNSLLLSGDNGNYCLMVDPLWITTDSLDGYKAVSSAVSSWLRTKVPNYSAGKVLKVNANGNGYTWGDASSDGKTEDNVSTSGTTTTIGVKTDWLFNTLQIQDVDNQDHIGPSNAPVDPLVRNLMTTYQTNTIIDYGSVHVMSAHSTPDDAVRRDINDVIDKLPGYKAYSVTSSTTDNISLTAYAYGLDRNYYSDMSHEGYRNIRDVVAHLFTNTSGNTYYSGFIKKEEDATKYDSLYTVSTPDPHGERPDRIYDTESTAFSIQVNPWWLLDTLQTNIFKPFPDYYDNNNPVFSSIVRMNRHSLKSIDYQEYLNWSQDHGTVVGEYEGDPIIEYPHHGDMAFQGTNWTEVPQFYLSSYQLDSHGHHSLMIFPTWFGENMSAHLANDSGLSCRSDLLTTTLQDNTIRHNYHYTHNFGINTNWLNTQVDTVINNQYTLSGKLGTYNVENTINLSYLSGDFLTGANITDTKSRHLSVTNVPIGKGIIARFHFTKANAKLSFGSTTNYIITSQAGATYYAGFVRYRAGGSSAAAVECIGIRKILGQQNPLTS